MLLHSGIAAVGILLLLTVVFHNARNLLVLPTLALRYGKFTRQKAQEA